jgi:hypothetical protein
VFDCLSTCRCSCRCSFIDTVGIGSALRSAGPESIYNITLYIYRLAPRLRYPYSDIHSLVAHSSSRSSRDTRAPSCLQMPHRVHAPISLLLKHSFGLSLQPGSGTVALIVLFIESDFMATRRPSLSVLAAVLVLTPLLSTQILSSCQWPDLLRLLYKNDHHYCQQVSASRHSHEDLGTVGTFCACARLL